MGHIRVIGNDANIVYSGGAFLSVSGQNLMYQGAPVKLRGVNENNVSALCMRVVLIEGSCDIADIHMREIDWIALGDMGCNVVRFGLSYRWWIDDPTGYYAVLDQQVQWAKQNNMWVHWVLFTTPGDCYEGYSQSCPIWGDEEEQTDLINFWVDMATHYVDEPTVAIFDLLNEPEPPGPGYLTTWVALAQEIITAIRAVNTRTIIAVEPTSAGVFETPFTGGNILYSPHDYLPGSMTHTTNDTTFYPGNAVDYDASTHYWDLAAIRKNPGDSGYDAFVDVGSRLPFDWAVTNNVPILVGEWGSVKRLNGYLTYIDDRRQFYMDDRNVSHTYFTWQSYENSFGLIGFGAHPYQPFNQAQMDEVIESWDGARPNSASNLTVANVQVPIIDGTATIGETLTGLNGIFRGYPRPTYAFQWQRDNSGGGTFSDISGETGLTYLVDAADEGCALRLKAVATNSGGSATAYSAATGLVTGDWTPADLGSGLVAYYDATDAANVTLDGSSRVSQCDDLSGNGWHLAQSATGGARPTLQTTGFKGLAFDGDNFGWMETAGTFPLGGNDAAVFASVYMSTTGTNYSNGRVVGFVASADGTDYASSSSASFLLRVGTTSVVSAYRSGFLADTPISEGAALRLGSVFDGTDHIIYLANTEVERVTHNNTFGSTGTLVIGGDNPGFGSSPHNGIIGRLIVMNRAPTSGERASIDAWLGA